MVLASAETLLNNDKIVTTPFKTVHKHKLHKFPFRKSFEPANNLCDIEEDEVLDVDEEFTPKLKIPASCLAGATFKPDSEEFDLFFATTPDKNATIADVKAWLKLWFESIGTFTNDLLVLGFLSSVTMDGNVLHDIPDFAWIESLLRNSNYNPNGNNKVWFVEDIIVNLAKYVFYAKVHAKKD